MTLHLNDYYLPIDLVFINVSRLEKLHFDPYWSNHVVLEYVPFSLQSKEALTETDHGDSSLLTATEII